MFLLDANVLIDSNRDYYPLGAVPEFWSWLSHMGNQGVVKIPREVYEEIQAGDDVLATWARNSENKTALLFEEDVDVQLVQTVTQNGYAFDLTDIEIETLGRDPFLIAYALKDNAHRTLVTNEVSKPNRERANRHIPDVCNGLSVSCINTFQFIKELGFSTNWADLVRDSDSEE